MKLNVVAVLGILIGGGVTSAFAAPIEFDVECGGNVVGSVSIDVGTNSKGSEGLTGGFTSTVGGPPPTIAAAAAACNQDHFNWYQVVTADNNPPNDAAGNALTPPYVDVPPGGYSGNALQWGDALPWYWDEYPAPAGTPGYDPGFQLSANVNGDKLNYEDFPGGAAGTDLEFSTWLVSVNADGSLDDFFDIGFSWDWSNSTGNGVVSNLDYINNGPTDADYADIIGGFASKVPEPSSWILMAGALAGLGMGVRRRART
jgi:hypothetical protein